MIDELEISLRRTVAEEIADYLSKTASNGRDLPDEADQRQMAAAILRRELDLRSRTALRVGELPLTADEEDRIAERVIETAFSVSPGLDRLMSRRDVCDIHINGCDDVRLGLVDGTVEHAGPIARTDEALIEMIQTMARRGGHMEREFTPNRPNLDLQLPDGSRLAAAAWVTKRPYLTIRRHLLVDADQSDLVRRGMYDEGLASLLRASVRSRKNILVAGGQGVGKTTLLRALAHEFDPDERVVVVEQEPELHLDASPGRHNQVLVFMERQANSEGVGAVTMADHGRTIKRFTPGRILFGEVRGPEVIDMLEGMTQGIAGSMCTIHADSSISVFPRLPIYARASGRDWTSADVLQLAAMALDLIVFVSRDRTKRRVVSEVRYVHGFDQQTGQVITDEWFAPDIDGRAAPNPSAPIPVRILDDLVDHGYNPSLHRQAFR